MKTVDVGNNSLLCTYALEICGYWKSIPTVYSYYCWCFLM